MEVKRTTKVDTDQFEVGDVIKFKLADVRDLKDVGDLLDLVARMTA